MSTMPSEAGSLREGSFIVIDNEPCRIVELEKSRTGKHGGAKARIVAVGLFDGLKRSIVTPVGTRVEVPRVDKRTAQVIAVLPGVIQLMDMENYTTFEMVPPKEEELKSKLKPGIEVEVWSVMNRFKIMRIR